MDLGLSHERQTTRHAPTQCPVCKRRVDAATGITDADKAPTPGDVSICVSCASVLMFTDGMGLRAVSAAELQNFTGKEQVLLRKLQSAVRVFRRSH